MLESLVTLEQDQSPNSVTVFWGARSAEDFYFDAQSIPAGQRFVPVLSRFTEGWAGAKGYVQNALLSMHPDLSSTVVYACGSDIMIRSAKTSLLDAGLPLNRFFADAFVASAAN